MGNYKRGNIVLATSCKFFENAKNSQSEWRKVLFAWIVNWFWNIYIKGFSSGHL